MYADLRPAVVRDGQRAEVVDFRRGDPRTGRREVPEELRLRGPPASGAAAGAAPASASARPPREALMYEHWDFSSEAPAGDAGAAAPRPPRAGARVPGRVPCLVVRPPRPARTAGGGGRAKERLPCLLFLHDLGACKEELIPRLEAAAQRGYCALALDARFHGQGGDPNSLARHLRAALATWRASDPRDRESLPASFLLDTVYDGIALLDFAALRPDVDPARVGVVGVGPLGGAAATALAAADPRVACCCCVAGLWSLPWALEHDAWAPLVENSRSVRDLHLDLGCECPAAIREALQGERDAPPPGRRVVEEAFRAWIPGVCDLWDPIAYLGCIAPRPCLVVAGELDEKCPCEVAELAVSRARAAYEDEGQPGSLQFRVLPGAGDFLPREADAAVDAFVDHFLGGSQPSAAQESELPSRELSLPAGGLPAEPEPLKYGEFTACPIFLGERAGYTWREGDDAPRGAGYYAQALEAGLKL